MTIGIIVGLSLVDPFFIQKEMFDSWRDYEFCTSEHQSILLIPIVQTMRLTFLILMSIAAYGIRSVPAVYNETKQLIFTIYNLTFLSIALPIFDSTVGRGKDVSLLTQGVSVCMICIITMSIMFLPKVILMKRGNPNIRGRTSTFPLDYHRSTGNQKVMIDVQTQTNHCTSEKSS